MPRVEAIAIGLASYRESLIDSPASQQLPTSPMLPSLPGPHQKQVWMLPQVRWM